MRNHSQALSQIGNNIFIDKEQALDITSSDWRHCLLTEREVHVLNEFQNKICLI
jgi:hypothetical protein